LAISVGALLSAGLQCTNFVKEDLSPEQLAERVGFGFDDLVSLFEYVQRRFTGIGVQDPAYYHLTHKTVYLTGRQVMNQRLHNSRFRECVFDLIVETARRTNSLRLQAMAQFWAYWQMTFFGFWFRKDVCDSWAHPMWRGLLMAEDWRQRWRADVFSQQGKTTAQKNNEFFHPTTDAQLLANFNNAIALGHYTFGPPESDVGVGLMAISPEGLSTSASSPVDANCSEGPDGRPSNQDMISDAPTSGPTASTPTTTTLHPRRRVRNKKRRQMPLNTDQIQPNPRGPPKPDDRKPSCFRPSQLSSSPIEREFRKARVKHGCLGELGAAAVAVAFTGSNFYEERRQTRRVDGGFQPGLEVGKPPRRRRTPIKRKKAPKMKTE